MTKQEAIWAASKLLCNIYHDDSGGDFEKIKAQAQIITAEADGNVDYLCSALDKVIEFCEKLKRGMYNQE